MKDIYFYNYYHYGDVYLNSKFIEDFASKYTKGKVYNIHNLHKEPFDYLFKYAINNNINEINPEIAQTLSNNLIEVITEMYDAYNVHLGKIWKLSEKKNVDDNGHTISINNLANGFERIFNKYNISMEKKIFYLPLINYQDDILVNPDKKNILICNGPCLSGQIANVPLDNLILFLAQYYNVYITHSLLNENENQNIRDLSKEFPIPNIHIIGSLAKKMDIIIGRDSGLFYWTQHRATIKKKFIIFTKGEYSIHPIFNVFTLNNYNINGNELLKIIK